MAVEAPLRPAGPGNGRAGRGRLVARLAGRSQLAVLSRWVLVAQVGLGIVAALVPLPVRTLVTLFMAALGVTALVVGVRWHRPVPRWGWWLLAAGVVASLGGVVALVAASGLPREAFEVANRPAPLDLPSTTLFATSYLLTIAGLALIGRPAGSRVGWVDLVDAAIVAAATFPVVWTFVVHPLIDLDAFADLAAILVPVSLILIVVLAVKLVLSVGLTWSAGWLIVSVSGLVTTNVGVVVPALVEQSPISLALVPFLWVLYPVGLGLAGLHPSVVATTTPPARPERQLSIARVALLGALALVVPATFVVQDVLAADERVHSTGDAAALVGPVVVVALLLVIRLAIATRVAQRRSEELSRQARELDVAAREQDLLRQQLTFRALHDPLTGLANRVVLAERLEWALSRRGGPRQHALLLLDLDGFKDVNDTLGHQAGDELLIAVAHRVLALVPEGGMLARLGGDELGVLLEDTDAAEAGAWAGQVLEAIRRPFRVGGRALYQTTSIGLAVLDSGDGRTTPSSALRDADLALHGAKSGGKDRVRRFEPAMVQARLAHSRLSGGLRRALRDDEFTLQYQPVVDLTTGQVRAVEALLRWHPSGGEAIPPEAFIPVAEETGMISEIGAWVLRQACARARSWYDSRGVAVAVNISGRQLVDPDFTAVVAEALSAPGLPGEGLIIEVTETSMIATATVDLAVRQLGELRDRGVRVAIDDFGTGYSSLSYLARLPVDILKIDSSFTRHGPRLTFGPDDWPFARAIMELGEGLNLTTVAEGIETAEQAEALRQLNCQLAQGFLFSRPLPAEAVDALLAMPVPVSRGAPRS